MHEAIPTNNKTESSEPLFFQHSYFVDSNGTLLPGMSGKPWVFRLLDADYDVWVGDFNSVGCDVCDAELHQA